MPRPSTVKTHNRRRFTPAEDAIIKDHVRTYGVEAFKILQSVLNRTRKQIRDRYEFYLKEEVVKGNWTDEEDEKLIELVRKTGFVWTKFVTLFPHRSVIDLKNRWRTTLSKVAAGDTQFIERQHRLNNSQEIKARSNSSVRISENMIEKIQEINWNLAELNKLTSSCMSRKAKLLPTDDNSLYAAVQPPDPQLIEEKDADPVDSSDFAAPIMNVPSKGTRPILTGFYGGMVPI